MGNEKTSADGVRRYEWVRNGMLCLTQDGIPIPWCAPDHFVLATDYDEVQAIMLRSVSQLIAKDAECAALSAELEAVRALVREAYEGGMVWRGDNIPALLAALPVQARGEK